MANLRISFEASPVKISYYSLWIDPGTRIHICNIIKRFINLIHPNGWEKFRFKENKLNDDIDTSSLDLNLEGDDKELCKILI